MLIINQTILSKLWYCFNLQIFQAQNLSALIGGDLTRPSSPFRHEFPNEDYDDAKERAETANHSRGEETDEFPWFFFSGLLKKKKAKVVQGSLNLVKLARDLTRVFGPPKR